MKVAHFCVITPRRCGLYETTRELVAGLRELGIDSRLVDPDKASNALYPNKEEDRSAPIADLEWAKTADVLVSHSGLGRFSTGAPVVHVSHGRPRHSFLSEANGGLPIYSHHYRTNKDSTCKAVVTFWPQHKPYLDVMYPDKPVHVVQSSVDLGFWSPGETEYNFGDKSGDLNVVCTDAWRDDIDAYVPLNAFALWARKSKAKLHLFGKPRKSPGWDALIKRIQDDGNMGLVQGWASELRHVYRAADLVITAHEIDVRTVREAMACDCPVLRIPTSLDADFDSALKQTNNRVLAENMFNPETTAKQFAEVLNAVH